MGYVFGKISDLHLKLPSSGLYLLVKASNVAAEPFYNAHRDRRDLLSTQNKVPADLDTHSRVVFGNGWYAANLLPRVARWMSGKSWLRFEAEPFTQLHLQLATHMPELRAVPLELEFKLNGTMVCALCLFEYDWLDLTIAIPEAMTAGTSEFKLEIRASRTWQPSAANPDSGDDRHLSIAVCDLEIS